LSREGGGTTLGATPEGTIPDGTWEDSMSALSYGRDRLGRWPEAGTLEWLVTNGIGGYAAGTVSGALTRRTHGLLVATLRPPLGRTLLLAKLAERVQLDGVAHDLDANLWASGVVRPSGYVALESFHLEDTVPAWIWAIGDARLEKRVWMEHGENATWVQYRLARGRGPAFLTLRALVNAREVDAPLVHGEGEGKIEVAGGSVRIEVREGAPPLWLIAPGAEIAALHDWYRGFALPRERESHGPAAEDHLCAAELRLPHPGHRARAPADAREEPARDVARRVPGRRPHRSRLDPGPGAFGGQLRRRAREPARSRGPHDSRRRPGAR
jgi:glycogen debranching enzyme